jgi:hypothetical protein
LSKVVGIYKKLSTNEKLIFQTKEGTPTIFVKNAQIKKWRGQETREVPILYSMTNVYLTNERLLFLIHSQIDALTFEKRKSICFSNVSGTWFEIPITAITNINVVNRDFEKDDNIIKIYSSFFQENSLELVQLIYNKRRTTGKIKEVVDLTFDSVDSYKVISADDRIDMIDKVIYKELVKQKKLNSEREKIEKLKKKLEKAKEREKKILASMRP